VAILANLATHSPLVRSQVASAVAAIAAIEIPRKEWLDLIPNLCSNAAHENLDVRMASLQTLGYICDELQVDDLTNELKNNIILALINNISLDPSMVKPTSLSVKALLSALPYASQNF
jgi:importin subunit beta-1